MTLVGSMAGLLSLAGLLILAVRYRRDSEELAALHEWAGHRPERERPARQRKPVRRWRRIGMATVSAAGVLGGLVAAVTIGHGQRPEKRRVGSVTAVHVAGRRAARVVVLNGSGIAGGAATAADVLRRRGFAIARVGNAPSLQPTSDLNFGRDDRPAAVRIGTILGIRPDRSPERTPDARTDVVVVLGAQAPR